MVGVGSMVDPLAQGLPCDQAARSRAFHKSAATMRPITPRAAATARDRAETAPQSTNIIYTPLQL